MDRSSGIPIGEPVPLSFSGICSLFAEGEAEETVDAISWQQRSLSSRTGLRSETGDH